MARRGGGTGGFKALLLAFGNKGAESDSCDNCGEGLNIALCGFI